ncbi:MAG TPA: NPCBM/NEW2 domain-containing protein [Planctomycetota bacterium]|nr:NPCBM/NEW2 domain-containing protein [Planctomycetota bacterium]
MRSALMLKLAMTAALLAAAPAGAVEVLARPVEGDDVRGTLSGLDGKALLVAPEGTQPRKLDLADLMAIEFIGAAAPASEGCAQLFTASGDVIPAKLEADAGGKITASSPWAGKFQVSSKALAGVLLPAGLKDAKARRELAKPGRRKDKIFLLNDEMEGTFEGFAGDSLKFKSDVLGTAEYKLAEVAAVAFAELGESPAPAGIRCTADLAGGGSVSGLPVKLEDGAILWRTDDGIDLRLVASTVKTIRVRSDRLVYLSELAPKAVEEKPFVEGLPFVWKFRNDVDVLGRPLVLGGVAFPRGLGTAASTKLTYNLEGSAFRHFRASVGVCDSAAPGGKTAFRVLVDGKEAFAAKPLLSRGDKPVKVDVKLEKAKELTLIVDFGDGSDLGDIGGWGDARLVK